MTASAHRPPTGRVRRDDLPLPLADCSENRMFSRAKVAFELWSSSAI